MINRERVAVDEHCAHHVHRVCWSAIFAGAFVGLGLGFLLHLYGGAISLSAYSSTPDGAEVIAIGGLLGMLIGVIASMAASGFVAGYLGRFHYRPVNGGIIYGFINWSMVIFLGALMMGPMAQYMSAYSNSLTHSNYSDIVNVDNDASNRNDDQGRVSSNTEGTSVAARQKAGADLPTDEKAKGLAWGGWVLFILFFVGAISSCVGATIGMQCKRDEVIDNHRNPSSI